jgi:hypothetical protein
MKDSLPPLLRGIGTLVMLTAAVIAFCIARQHNQSRRTLFPATALATGKRSGDSLTTSVSETHEVPAGFAQDDVLEDVLENVWFECLGFAGTAVFAASFFVEAYARRLGVRPIGVALAEEDEPGPEVAAIKKGFSEIDG